MCSVSLGGRGFTTSLKRSLREKEKKHGHMKYYDYRISGIDRIQIHSTVVLDVSRLPFVHLFQLSAAFIH